MNKAGLTSDADYCFTCFQLLASQHNSSQTTRRLRGKRIHTARQWWDSKSLVLSLQYSLTTGSLNISLQRQTMLVGPI